MLINVRSLTGDATTVVVPDAGATGAHVRAALAALRGVKPRKLALFVKVCMCERERESRGRREERREGGGRWG